MCSMEDLERLAESIWSRGVADEVILAHDGFVCAAWGVGLEEAEKLLALALDLAQAAKRHGAELKAFILSDGRCITISEADDVILVSCSTKPVQVATSGIRSVHECGVEASA